MPGRKRKPPVPDDVAENHKAVMAWLVDIATGKADLPAVDAAVPAPATGGPVAEAHGNDRVFTREDMRGL